MNDPEKQTRGKTFLRYVNQNLKILCSETKSELILLTLLIMVTTAFILNFKGAKVVFLQTKVENLSKFLLTSISRNGNVLDVLNSIESILYLAC